MPRDIRFLLPPRLPMADGLGAVVRLMGVNDIELPRQQCIVNCGEAGIDKGDQPETGGMLALDPMFHAYSRLGIDGGSRTSCQHRVRGRHPDTATAAFAEVRALADIPAVTRLHDLRHSLASAMLRSKVHPR